MPFSVAVSTSANGGAKRNENDEHQQNGKTQEITNGIEFVELFYDIVDRQFLMLPQRKSFVQK